MRNVLRLAWLTSVRQPSRTALGVLGVAAVGALLFDMLLLSRGLVLSFRDLLDRAGFDVRVLASDSAPFSGPLVEHAAETRAMLAALPGIEAVVPISVREASIVPPPAPPALPVPPAPEVQFIGADPDASPMWTLIEGRELPADAADTPPLLVNRTLAGARHLAPGARLTLRGECGGEAEAVPPLVFTIAGIAEFPFDDQQVETVAGRLTDLRRLCGEERADAVDMLLVRADPRLGSDRAAAAIRAARPGLHVVTNEELVERFSRVEFSYFRQISFVLATVTLVFGFLLIAVLLTASVNERLGYIAALRALGLSRGRVVAGVLCESMLMVAAGAVLAIPVGLALSVWLDRILRSLPGIPANVHFFVFETRALAAYGWLLAAASIAAAAYPMRIVAALPIAATLRREVVG
jgi:putative ABC transport system permease protein